MGLRLRNDAWQSNRPFFCCELERILLERLQTGGAGGRPLLIDEAQSFASTSFSRKFACSPTWRQRPTSSCPLVLVGTARAGRSAERAGASPVEAARRDSVRPGSVPASRNCAVHLGAPGTRGRGPQHLHARSRRGDPRMFTGNSAHDQRGRGNTLISGFALNRRPIDRSIVMEVCRDLDLLPAFGPGAALPALG